MAVTFRLIPSLVGKYTGGTIKVTDQRDYNVGAALGGGTDLVIADSDRELINALRGYGALYVVSEGAPTAIVPDFDVHRRLWLGREAVDDNEVVLQVGRDRLAPNLTVDAGGAMALSAASNSPPAERVLEVKTYNPAFPSGRVRFAIENNQDTATQDVWFHDVVVAVGHWATTESADAALALYQPNSPGTTNMLQVFKPGSQTQKVFYVDPNGGQHIVCKGLASKAWEVIGDGEANPVIRIMETGAIERGPGGATSPTCGIYFGTGTPEGAVTAGVGSLFQRTDGSAGTSLYVKQTGTGNTGWVGK